MAPCFDRVTGKKKKKKERKKTRTMLATDVHENIYLNVTKLRVVTVLPPGPGRTFPGFEVDGQRCHPIARGWAVPGRQVQLGAVSVSAQACQVAGLGFVSLRVSRRVRLPSATLQLDLVVTRFPLLA